MKAFLICLVIGAILGFVLGIASKIFAVEQDPRLDKLNEMLPGYNCGACGYPGCSGMAEAIIEGKTDKLLCKPIKPDMRNKIVEYLENTPGPDSKTIKLKG